MYNPILKNHVNNCHGNHEFFHSAKFIFEDKYILCISGVPMNDLAPMKKIVLGCKVGQISSRGSAEIYLIALIDSPCV